MKTKTELIRITISGTSGNKVRIY